MAKFDEGKAPKPIEIDKFLGLNESVGETEIKLGEAVKQLNFRTTNNYKAQSRPGQLTLVDYDNSKEVYGLWYGTLGGNEVLISVNDGKVYEYDFSTEVNTNIGTITDAPCTIFWFQSKIYFLNGTDFKEYDGTTYQDVDPYVPTIYIGSPPAGGGTAFEQINLLGGAKKQEFVGDGASTTYQLAETDIDSDTVLVSIDGTDKTENTHFTVNRSAATLDFSAGTSPHGAPANEAEVVVQWVKDSATNKALVTSNRFAMDFGPGNDTAVFLWGNTNAKNRRMWSGTLDASYWPVFNFTLIGTDQFAITDIVAQYDRQIIFKEKRTFYSYAEYQTTTDAYDYPVFDLNEKLGHVAFGQAQLVENYPASLSGQSIWRWTNTSSEDERNARIISENIRKSLQDLDLTQAVTFDFQKEKEYWLNVGDHVYIWNYGNDTFYIYDNVSANQFVQGDDTIYFGTTGKIIEINEDYLNDDGTAITKELELGFTDFGVNHLLKNSRKLWLTVEPQSRTSVDVLWQTDRKSLTDDDALEYSFVAMDFGSVDFGDFGFSTNQNPQPVRFKIRAKKYAYIKFIFKNSEDDEKLTLLSLKVMAETTSEVK